jgi:hypothetical protein
MSCATNVLTGGIAPFSPDLKDFMHKISTNRILDWGAMNEWYYPSAVGVQCGHCQAWANLSIHGQPILQADSSSWLIALRCIRCKNISKMFVDKATEGKKQCGEIWIFPAPKYREAKIPEELIDNKRINKAYRDALDCFNENKASLAISSCGRIVEAIGKIKFPNSKDISNIKPLFNNLRKELKQAPAFKEILMPLIELGEALRLGRNPGSHFDLETDPDLALAGKVLDLTEFLLQYVYVIAGESIAVEQLINQCGPGDTEED